MRATDFIKNKLNDLIENFPQMKVSYKFDDFANSHFIEVLPAKVFKDNSVYSEYETQLIIDFISEFPNEEIVFVTKNDLIEITNPLFVKEGYLFNNEILFWNSNIWSNNLISDFNFNFEALSNKTINSIDLISDSFELFESNNIDIKPIKEKPVEIILDSDDFALAA